VWLETDPPFSILDPGLPATVNAGREWETAIKEKDLPLTAGSDITPLVRVRLSGDKVLKGTARKDVPPAGAMPRG
jgi:hypothetical protein